MFRLLIAAAVIGLAASQAQAQGIGGSVDNLKPHDLAEIVNPIAGIVGYKASYTYNMVPEEDGEYYEAELRLYVERPTYWETLEIHTVTGYCPEGEAVWFDIDEAEEMSSGWYKVMARIKKSGDPWTLVHQYATHEFSVFNESAAREFRRQLLFQEH